VGTFLKMTSDGVKLTVGGIAGGAAKSADINIKGSYHFEGSLPENESVAFSGYFKIGDDGEISEDDPDEPDGAVVKKFRIVGKIFFEDGTEGEDPGGDDPGGDPGGEEPGGGDPGEDPGDDGAPILAFGDGQESTIMLQVNKSVQLKLIIKNVPDIRYVPSSANIIVSATGLVTGKKAGSAVITVKSASNPDITPLTIKVNVK